MVVQLLVECQLTTQITQVTLMRSVSCKIVVWLLLCVSARTVCVCVSSNRVQPRQQHHAL